LNELKVLGRETAEASPEATKLEEKQEEAKQAGR
jgi:hypothetical protein